MPPFIEALLTAGFRLLANAVLVKGKAFLEEKTGVKLDQPTLTADDQNKLQKFQKEHEEELLRLMLENNKLGLEESKLDLESFKAQLGDIANARTNNTDLLTNEFVPWYAKAIQPTLAVIVIALSFVLFVLFIVWSGYNPDGTAKLNETQREILIYILGVLSAAFTQVLGYYFGSSQSSANKSAQIGQVLQEKSATEVSKS